MENHFSSRQGSFDFIDRFIDLFHHAEPQEKSPADNKARSLTEEFETALVSLEQTIAMQKHDMEQKGQADWKRSLKAESEEVKKAKEREIHSKISMDILATHSRLQTGITPHELDLLNEYLDKAAEISLSGEQTQEVMPRCRFSILKRIHYESGVLALQDMDGYMASHGETWPARIPRDPTISKQEAEQVVNRNLLSLRRNFINYTIHQSSRLIVGIIEAWKSDYPEVDSPLWKSVVLEAVATALRAKLMHTFTSRLRHDRAYIENKAKELIGAKLSELNRTLQGGLTSLNDAHRVVSSSLKILDEIIPSLAWKHLQEVFPEAKPTEKGH
ncbi:MAG: hypothetical protein JRE16_02460 [Deltaproteobacteria bacterium]|jgi:hypothetical protein|nr:hypothetical protein [Deltaproteobacteria bacterium]